MVQRCLPCTESRPVTTNMDDKTTIKRRSIKGDLVKGLFFVFFVFLQLILDLHPVPNPEQLWKALLQPLSEMSTICGVLAVEFLAFLSDALPDTGGGGGISSISLSFFTSQKLGKVQ